MPSKMVEAVRFLGLEIEVLYSQTTLLKAPASEGELCASEIGVAHCLSRGVGHIVEQRDVDHRRKARPGSSGQSDHASPPAPGERPAFTFQGSSMLSHASRLLQAGDHLCIHLAMAVLCCFPRTDQTNLSSAALSYK